jgi:hypothetical protein
MSDTKLLPCPFPGCGGEARYQSEGASYMNKPPRFKVGCRKAACFAYIAIQQASYATPEEAVEAWNRRASAALSAPAPVGVEPEVVQALEYAGRYCEIGRNEVGMGGHGHCAAVLAAEVHRLHAAPPASPVCPWQPMKTATGEPVLVAHKAWGVEIWENTGTVGWTVGKGKDRCARNPDNAWGWMPIPASPSGSVVPQTKESPDA